MGNSVQHLPARMAPCPPRRTVVPMAQAPQVARQVKAVPAAAKVVPAAAKVDLAVNSVAEMRSAEVTSLLTANADSYTWVAAASGSQSAATYQLLAAGYSVMPIGGFNGSDPSPHSGAIQAVGC